jgi:purine catabolism regulator
MEIKNMIKVEDVLGFNCMEGSKLVAGHMNKHNVIQSVNVMDAPDIVKWINKNELLLTTGYAINNNRDFVTELIKGLKEKGCAALGIKSKRYFDSIPDYIIEIANTYGLPLIELSYQVTFSQIITEIIEKDINSSEKYINIKRLIDEGLEQQSLENVIKILSKILNRYMSLESIYLDTPISYYKGNKSKAILNIIKENDIFQHLSDNIENKVLLQKKSFTQELMENILNLKSRIVIPVNFSTKAIGYLALWYEEDELLIYDDSAIEYGLSLITFLLKEQKSHMIINKKLKTKIVHDLINYKTDIIEKIHKEADYAGISLKGSYVVISFLNPNPKLSNTKAEELNFNDVLFRLDRYLYKYLGMEPLIGQYNGNIILILYNVNGDRINYVDKIVDLIIKSETLMAFTEEFIIGISDHHTKFEQINKAYNESLNAIELAKERKKKVMKYMNLGIVGYFLKPGQGMGLNDIIDSTIKPILDTDECDGKLYFTLQNYFRNNERLIETSNALFLHRNSLKYRLDIIKKLTGLDLDNTEDKLRLYLGVKAYEILTLDDYSDYKSKRQLPAKY